MTRARLLAKALIVLAPTVPAAAQTAEWRLPVDAAAIYVRDAHWRPVALDGKPSVSSGGHAGRVPPLLHGSELDEARLQRSRPVCDLYDLLPWLAFDLTTWKGTKVDRVFRRVPWFGDVRVTGRASAPGSSGRQSIRLQVRSLSKMDTSDISAEFAKSLEWYLDEHIDGDLTIERTFDPELGLITSFRADFEATLVDTNEGKGERRRFGLSGYETWTLDRVQLPDGDFRTRVNEAIDRAAAYELRRLGEFADSTLRAEEGRGNIHGPTFHAIELLALARAGVSFKDPVAAASLEQFAAREFSHTNTLALAVLAIDAFHAASTERAAQVAGEANRVPERKLPARERQWVQRWTAMILDNLDVEAWAGGLAVWWFVSDGYEDVGTTWLALQALDAAERCGVSVPFEIWPAAARWLLDAQRPSGILATDPVRYLRGGGSADPVEAAGWSDHARDEWEHCHGAATAEALAALVLCGGRLQRRVDHADLLARVESAIDGGLAWLASDFTTHFNPAPHPVYWQHGDDLRLALPFALEALGVTRIRGCDWYFDGACALLAAQRADGRMGDTVFGTAAALVFLRRTAAGPVTGWRDR